MTTKAIENYSYILIDTPELKEKYAPRQQLDEFYSPVSGWLNADTWSGGKFRDDCVYRRRIPIGEGFELVGIDEKLNDGDEFFHLGTWERIYAKESETSKNRTIREYIEVVGCDPYLNGVRRRKSAVKTDGWIGSKSKLPEVGRSIWWYSPASPRVEFCSKVYTPEALVEYFWKYAEVPLPPAPVKSDEEIAFDKAWNLYVQQEPPASTKKAFKRGWSDAVAFAKSQQQ